MKKKMMMLMILMMMIIIIMVIQKTDYIHSLLNSVIIIESQIEKIGSCQISVSEKDRKAQMQN
jgi:hypothetical protein